MNRPSDLHRMMRVPARTYCVGVYLQELQLQLQLQHDCIFFTVTVTLSRDGGATQARQEATQSVRRGGVNFNVSVSTAKQTQSFYETNTAYDGEGRRRKEGREERRGGASGSATVVSVPTRTRPRRGCAAQWRSV